MPANTLEQDIARDSAQKPAQDKLDFVRDQIRYMRDLEKQIVDTEEILKRLKAEKQELQHNVLPTLFMQNKITAISLSEEGNLPAYDAELKDYYHANIKADWLPAQRASAIAWLDKHKLADIVKTVFTIEIGRGNAKLTKQVTAALRALKVPFTVQQTVPWKTLTAAVKEIYRSHRTLKDDELKVLGASVGKVVTLQQQKEKRNG
jgi:hypothetical protein